MKLHPPGGGGRLIPLADVEKAHILNVLEATGNNRTQAARVLGIGLRTLQRKLQEWAEAADMPE